MKFEIIKRRAKHLAQSGCITIGFEHFLVMFPSAMLIARLANSSWGTVIELPTILFACGAGTLVFGLLTKWRIPFFLGPSFAYIGFVSYQIAQISSADDIAAIRTTIFYGYVIAGVLLFCLSWLYRYKATKKIIETLFPSTIMGPSIALIGLELADMAAMDSGFSGGSYEARCLAIITLACIIVFSLLRHHFFQNASILIGIFIGCVAASIMGQIAWPKFDGFVLKAPKLYFSHFSQPPNQWLALVAAVFPCTMIAFVESIGRITVYDGMLKRDERQVDNNVGNKALVAHSCSSILTSISNLMPSAIYAENLAIMNLHSAELSTKRTVHDEDRFVNNCYSSYSFYPYTIASIISIAVAFFPGLQNVFLAIPMSILGGMELFVFGLISAPGIQMLVDQQVNYKKVSNQIITAAVLLAGISDISIVYESLTLRGMSLGLTIGVVVNLIALLLKCLGLLNEKCSIVEIIDECIVTLGSTVRIRMYEDMKVIKHDREIRVEEIKDFIRKKENVKLLNAAAKIELQDCFSKKRILLLQHNGRIELQVALPQKYRNKLFIDNSRIVATHQNGKEVKIVLDENVSNRLLGDILKNAI